MDIFNQPPNKARFAQKHDPCSACFAPSTDTPHKLCSGCKAVVYCSAQCQRTSWRTHKIICAGFKKQLGILSAHADAHSSAFNSVGRPHPRDEFLLVNQFARTHRRTIEQAAYSAIRLSGHTIETFDFLSHFLSIHLKYRQDWSGNPATAFQVLESRLLHLNVLNPQMRAQFDKSIASRDAMVEVAKKTVENLPAVAGPLTIYCTSGSLGCWSMTTIFVIPQVQIFRDMGILPDPHYEQWFLRFRTIVDEGHILVRAGSDADWWIGRMEKVGSKWKQIKLSDEEYRACGYPEHPGLLY